MQTIALKKKPVTPTAKKNAARANLAVAVATNPKMVLAVPTKKNLKRLLDKKFTIYSQTKSLSNHIGCRGFFICGNKIFSKKQEMRE